MSRLRLRLAVSLDGYVAGPNQGPDHPLGEGGMRLHEWVFPLRTWRAMHGMEGGVENESAQVLEGATAGVGATIMGRRMFGGPPGPWDPAAPWDGWWGRTPPFGHPVFVLTHYARAPLVLDGGTTFHFVTDGTDAALARAREAAAGRDVVVAGGARAARQYLAAGLVDEMLLHLAPVLLGSGERLFEGLGDDLRGLRLARTVAAADVTHLHFAR